MRITRAAKVAAFPLIVLALVALVACQGGPGTKGDKGDKGDTGQMGDSGDPGNPGINELTARGVGPLLVFIDDGKTAAGGAVIGTLPDPIDMAMHFRGGYRDITYTAAMADATSMSTFTGSIEAGTSILKIALRTATTTVVPPEARMIADDNGTANSIITVTATDTEGNKAMTDVHVLANRAPVAETPTTVWSTNVGTEVRAGKMVQDCADSINDPVPATHTAHQCKLTAGMDDFMDDGPIVLSVVTTNPKVSVTTAKNVLTITGLTSTWNPDRTGSPGHDAAEVTIRATDGNGLYVERALEITVDGAPTVKRQIQNRTLKDEGMPVDVARSIATFFADDVVTALVVGDIGGESSDKTTATVSFMGDDLKVTPLNPGTTMITVTATETSGYEQSVSQTFMVTVTNASP